MSYLPINFTSGYMCLQTRVTKGSITLAEQVLFLPHSVQQPSERDSGSGAPSSPPASSHVWEGRHVQTLGTKRRGGAPFPVPSLKGSLILFPEGRSSLRVGQCDPKEGIKETRALT